MDREKEKIKNLKLIKSIFILCPSLIPRKEK